jgi:hypothetical protein
MRCEFLPWLVPLMWRQLLLLRDPSPPSDDLRRGVYLRAVTFEFPLIEFNLSCTS